MVGENEHADTWAKGYERHIAVFLFTYMQVCKMITCKKPAKDSRCFAPVACSSNTIFSARESVLVDEKIEFEGRNHASEHEEKKHSWDKTNTAGFKAIGNHQSKFGSYQFNG